MCIENFYVEVISIQKMSNINDTNNPNKLTTVNYGCNARLNTCPITEAYNPEKVVTALPT